MRVTFSIGFSPTLCPADGPYELVYPSVFSQAFGKTPRYLKTECIYFIPTDKGAGTKDYKRSAF
jgi:hypothetical protein